MALVINDIKTDLPKLNTELRRLDYLHNQVKTLADKLQTQSHMVEVLKGQQENFLAINNLKISWDGASTLSWPAGYIRDKSGTIFQVGAGSQSGLTANSHYWLAWNPVHRRMAIRQSLSDVADPTNLVVCQVPTAAAGVVGGGGSDVGGSGVNGKQY